MLEIMPKEPAIPFESRDQRFRVEQVKAREPYSANSRSTRKERIPIRALYLIRK